MTLEDSDAHARRNVVLLSASMLLAAWLKQDLPGLLSAVGVSHVRPDIAQRLWAALFVLMVYLLARYHFSPDRAIRWAAGAKVVHALQHRWLKPWAKRHQAAKINSIRAEKNPNRSQLSADDLGIPWLAVSGWRDVHFQFRHVDEYDEEFNERYRDDNCEVGRLPKVLAFLNFIASFVVRMVLSRDGLEVAVPYWLAVAALLVSAFKAGWLS